MNYHIVIGTIILLFRIFLILLPWILFTALIISKIKKPRYKLPAGLVTREKEALKELKKHKVKKNKITETKQELKVYLCKEYRSYLYTLFENEYAIIARDILLDNSYLTQEEKYKRAFVEYIATREAYLSFKEQQINTI